MIAYLSAEIGLYSELHTYSGGLGVLAGDHLKSAADEGLDIAAVTLLYREGYGRQHLDAGKLDRDSSLDLLLEENVDVLGVSLRHLESVEDPLDMVVKARELQHHLFDVELLLQDREHCLELLTLSHEISVVLLRPFAAVAEPTISP